MLERLRKYLRIMRCLRSSMLSSRAELSKGTKHTSIKTIWMPLFIADKLLPVDQIRQYTMRLKFPGQNLQIKFTESNLAKNP